MKQWQSILLTVVLSICLIAGSISIAFNVAPILVSISTISNSQQQIVQFANELNQRVKQLEQKKEK